MATAVDKKHMLTVCKIGKGVESCSFLVQELGAGFACAKGSDAEALIRRRREAKEMRSQGDNCAGPPDFEPNDA